MPHTPTVSSTGCQGVGEQRDVGVRTADAHADARVGDDRLDLDADDDSYTGTTTPPANQVARSATAHS